MIEKIGERQWIEKYKSCLQNESLIRLIKYGSIPEIGSWAFLKLAFLWSCASTYTNIIGHRYPNIFYVDLFSGSGLYNFKDYSKNKQFLLGSSILMSTATFKYPFKKCFFFEKNRETANLLEKRLCTLKDNKKLTCNNYILLDDSNKKIEEVISEISGINGVHFLLFVDPYSTEIHWNTMKKLLSLAYPSFDMIFNFQPFGINRKSYSPETLIDYFGDEEYNKYLRKQNVLDLLESYYIQKLKKYKMVKTTKIIKIESGKGGFYYDLIYTTRKDKPQWLPAIEHIKKMTEKFTGYEVSIISDPLLPSLTKF